VSPPREDHVLTVDVGTSAVRVSAVSLAGNLLAVARAPGHPLIAGDNAVLDAPELWSDVCRLIREVSEQAGQPIALGVACQLGMVLVDAAITPIAPVFLWQDRRASAEADEIKNISDGRDSTIGGRAAAPELTAARVRWVAKNQSADWERTRWVLSLKDFVLAKLTGRVATDPTSASYTLLFDVRQRAWSAELMAAAGVSIERLPPVLGAQEAGGGVATDVAESIGVRSGVPVAVGGPDGSVAALGSGAVRAGLTFDIAGTTDVLLSVCDRPIVDPERRSILNAYLLPGLWTVGGPTGLTGGAIAWLAGVLGYASVEQAYRELGAASAAIAPGAEGVTFHTALTGERFPNWSSQRTGSVSGLTPGHTVAHLLRAAEEGAAFTVREGLEVLVGLGVDVGQIRISGGVTKRTEAMQLRANVWRQPVVGVSNPEATTLGAAILATVCAGVYPSVEAAAASMVRLDAAVEPEPSTADAYTQAYVRWQAARHHV